MKPKRGFIALISVLIISAVLLTTVLSVAYRGLSSRFLMLDLENKVESEKFAEACTEVARVVVANDKDRALSLRTVPVGDGACTIVSIAPNIPAVGQTQIDASASSTGATTNLRVIVDSLTASILSSEELSTF